jgi:hypothetical protein
MACSFCVIAVQSALILQDDVGLSGFFGRLIRGRIRREVQKGVLAYLSETKKKLEQQAR